MKRGQILGILSLFLLCAIAIFPAVAENVTVTSTHDIATDYYNYGELCTFSRELHRCDREF